MTRKDFVSRIESIFGTVTKEMDGQKFESVSTWQGKRIANVFAYAATSEKCMEHNLEEICGRERKTTFMSDLSIGEWSESWRGVFDTTRSALLEWRDNVEYIAEFVLCVNWKAWEHHARGNESWTKFYSLLYDGVRDLMFDYYEGDEEKASYLFEYLD